MGKTCLITGAANGIGYEFAKIFHSKGYNLVLIDIDIIKLKEIKKDFESTSDNKVLIIQKDLCRPDIASEIYSILHSRKIQVEVLINNAGFGMFGFFHETKWEEHQKLIHITVLTTTHLTNLFLKDMLKRNSGKILNVSSIAAFQPGPLMSTYYAAKAFLLSFSQAVSNELMGTKVTVTALCPGMTKTGFQYSTGNGKPYYGLLCTSPKKVARYGIIAMEKGRMVAIPCFYNRIIANIHRFTSFNLAVKLSRFFQERNRVKDNFSL